jgi:cytochrome c oxidase cbb3-type subunit 4
MLKFIKHNMETIAGIEIYPILSLLLFFLFFVGLYFWVFTYNKEKIKQLGNLPFSEETSDEFLKS